MYFYTLVTLPIAMGSTIGADNPEETYVTADPRRLPVDVMTDGQCQTAMELVQSTDLALVRVEPIGEVTEPVADVTAPIEYRCFTATGGWTVTGIEASTDAVLGPQATRIREVVALAEDALRGDADPRAHVYADAVNTTWSPSIDEPAEAALKSIGADGMYWTACEYGGELLALAARDLIGTVPGWTREAYDALTEPWRIAMALPAHPDDTAPVQPRSA